MKKSFRSSVLLRLFFALVHVGSIKIKQHIDIVGTITSLEK